MFFDWCSSVDIQTKASEVPACASSPEEWEWATMVRHTRVFDFRGAPEECDESGPGLMSALQDCFVMNAVALAPVADAMNTGSQQEQTVEFGSGCKFCFQAKVDIPAGAELIDNYNSNLNNDFLVSKWGFLISGNTHPVKPLGDADCQQLAEAVGPALARKDGTCAPPKEEKQKGAFCTLARISAEHCGERLRTSSG